MLRGLHSSSEPSTHRAHWWGHGLGRSAHGSGGAELVDIELDSIHYIHLRSSSVPSSNLRAVKSWMVTVVFTALHVHLAHLSICRYPFGNSLLSHQESRYRLRLMTIALPGWVSAVHLMEQRLQSVSPLLSQAPAPDAAPTQQPAPPKAHRGTSES